MTTPSSAPASVCRVIRGTTPVSPRPSWSAPVLLAALAAALLLRLGAAGVAGARSVGAGAGFGMLLLAVAMAAGWRPAPPRGRDLAAAGLGCAVLLAGPLARHLLHPGVTPAGSFAAWAPVVVLVAVAEESLLRGALWTVLSARRGPGAALVISTVAFAALHVPLYGWGSVPLDLAVGVLLGGLRWWTGRTAAPVLVHAVADLAGWWLR